MSAGPPVMPRASTLLPGYTVISHLRRGERLDVYDVWSNKRECRCIAKVLRPDCRDHGRARRRLIREGRLLLGSSHPHLVRAYELVSRPSPAVILETLGGETLGALIERRTRRLSRTELAYLGIHLGSALGYLHRRRILHLDLKPTNVVCHPDGRAVLIDLSVAGRSGLSLHPRGTRRYMAPEQFRWNRLGPATDVWGLGTVLFSAAAGEDPFPSADRSAPAPPLATKRPRMPRELNQLVDRCLRRDPTRRPTLADAMATLSALAEQAGPVIPIGEAVEAQ